MNGLAISKRVNAYASAPENLYFKEGKLRLCVALLIFAVLSSILAGYVFERYGSTQSGNGLMASVLFVIYFAIGFPAFIFVEMGRFENPRGTVVRRTAVINMLWFSSILALLFVVPFLLPTTGGWVYFTGIAGVLYGTGITFLILYIKVRRAVPPERNWSLPIAAESLWPEGQLLQLRNFVNGSTAIVVLTKEELHIGEESRPMKISEEMAAIDGVANFGGYAFYPGKIVHLVSLRPSEVSKVTINPGSLYSTFGIWTENSGDQGKRVFRGNRFDNPFAISALALKDMQQRILDPRESIRRHARRIATAMIEKQLRAAAPQADFVVNARTRMSDQELMRLVK